MFDHFTIDTSATAGRATDPDDGDISPIDSPSPPPRESTSPPVMSRSASSVDLYANPNQPPSSIDNLVQRMNRQTLWLDGLGTVPPPAYLPSSPAISDRPSLPPLPELEVDDQEPAIELDSVQARLGLSPLAAPLSASPLEADELEPDLASLVADTKRLRRQVTSQFNNPDNTKSIHALVEDMIATGSQCRVHTGPPPTPTSLRLAPILEPDDDLNLLCVDLEVDEAICNEDSWADSFCRGSGSAGTSGIPAGIRKNGILRYRLSLDAAMRCANVERKRPRMRKRKRPGSNKPIKSTPSLASLASTDSSPSLASLGS